MQQRKSARTTTTKGVQEIAEDHAAFGSTFIGENAATDFFVVDSALTSWETLESQFEIPRLCPWEFRGARRRLKGLEIREIPMGVSIDKKLGNPDASIELAHFGCQHELAFGVSYALVDESGKGGYQIRVAANSYDYRLSGTIRTPGEGSRSEIEFLQAVLSSLSSLSEVSCDSSGAHVRCSTTSPNIRIRDSNQQPAFTTAVRWHDTQRNDERVVQDLTNVAGCVADLNGFSLKHLNFGVSCHEDNWEATTGLLASRYPTWDVWFEGKYLNDLPDETLVSSSGYWRFPIVKGNAEGFSTWIDLVTSPTERFIEYQTDGELSQAFASLDDTEEWNGEYSDRWGLLQLASE